MEFALPILLLVSFVGIALSGAIPQVAAFVNLFFLFMLLAIGFDWFRISRRLKKDVAEKFPERAGQGRRFLRRPPHHATPPLAPPQAHGRPRRQALTSPIRQ